MSTHSITRTLRCTWTLSLAGLVLASCSSSSLPPSQEPQSFDVSTTVESTPEAPPSDPAALRVLLQDHRDLVDELSAEQHKSSEALSEVVTLGDYAEFTETALSDMEEILIRWEASVSSMRLIVGFDALVEDEALERFVEAATAVSESLRARKTGAVTCNTHIPATSHNEPRSALFEIRPWVECWEPIRLDAEGFQQLWATLQIRYDSLNSAVSAALASADE